MPKIKYLIPTDLIFKILQNKVGKKKLIIDTATVTYRGSGSILNTPVIFRTATNNINPIINRQTKASRLSAFSLYSFMIFSEKFIHHYLSKFKWESVYKLRKISLHKRQIMLFFSLYCIIINSSSNIDEFEKNHISNKNSSKRLLTMAFGPVPAILRNCFSEYSPHLVLMDIGLPFYNGFYHCSEIRRISKVPVVFLSSASDNMNIVMAMNMGGDDFIAKPFDLTVLMAKIQAILRRTYDFSSETNVITHKGAMLNISDATLSFNGEKIDLTKNEYRILLTLLENKGKVVSRDFLMNKLWETDSYVDENTLTVNVSRLRKKLENSGLTDFIVTRSGMGYIVE